MTLLALALLASLTMPEAEVKRAQALEELAREHQRAGRYLDAQKPLEEAIALWTRYRGPDDVDALNDTMNLAVALRRYGATERAIPLLERVVQKLGESADADAPRLRQSALNNLATAYSFAGRPVDARHLWEQMLEPLRDGAPSEARARVLDNLAGTLLTLGDLPGAQAHAERGYADWRALRGELDVDTAISRGVLGELALASGEVAKARAHLRASLRTRERLLGPQHGQLTGVLNSLGKLERSARRPQVAAAYWRRSLAIGRKHLAPDHTDIREATEGLASLGAR